MSCAIECLHMQYPGRYVTHYRGTAPEIFENNPRITPGDGGRRLLIQYPLINKSNQRPVHFVQGYVDDLARQLDLRLECMYNRPFLYLSEEEKSWTNQVEETFGYKGPYWVICSGIKDDYTVKGWGTSNYQAVVDKLRGLVQFVQVGESHHKHPLLNGVLDLRGKTTTRQLIRLAYNSAGGIGGVSFLHHVYAALEKPFVCIASGLEPRSWEAYNSEAYLTRQGMLSCCRLGGCWKAKVDRDCEQPMVLGTEKVPRCMMLIPPDEVVQAVLTFSMLKRP